jgi:hypothetical protein
MSNLIAKPILDSIDLSGVSHGGDPVTVALQCLNTHQTHTCRVDAILKTELLSSQTEENPKVQALVEIENFDEETTDTCFAEVTFQTNDVCSVTIFDRSYHPLIHEALENLQEYHAELEKPHIVGWLRDQIPFPEDDSQTSYTNVRDQIESLLDTYRESSKKPTHSPLLSRWLGAVNQPVLNNIQELLSEALEETADNGNFSFEECQMILKEIIDSTPPKPSKKSKND